jgi:hypothetical protein
MEMGGDVSTHKLLRIQLYERVWTIPMRTLAAEFGISDVGLSKLCHRHRIPTPPRGYWVQREHGKAQSLPTLPQAEKAAEIVVIERTPALRLVEASPTRHRRSRSGFNNARGHHGTAVTAPIVSVEAYPASPTHPAVKSPNP